MWNKRIFNKTWVDMVHRVAQKYNDETGEVEAVKNNNVYNSQMTKQNYLQRWLPATKETQIAEHLTNAVFEANQEMYGYDVWFKPGMIQYTTYDYANQGDFPWHSDSFMFGKPTTQKLTIIVGLTDKNNYEGGMFEIMNSNLIQLKIDLGQVLVFPSFNCHRVTPVTKGTRRTLVTWYSGPMWR
jgi:PKHD-type hydroxylase